MRFRAECPHCHGVLLLRQEDAGTEVRCPRCKKRLQAPPEPSGVVAAEGSALESPKASDAAGDPPPPDAAIQLFQEIQEDGLAAEPTPPTSLPAAQERSPAPAAVRGPVAPIEPDSVGGLVWPRLREGVGSPPARREPVPTVVSVYGIIIMVVMALATLGFVIEALLQLPPILRNAGAKGFYYLAIISAVWLGLLYFLYRVGKGMREGRRWAIVALSVICGLAALQMMLMWVLIGQFEPLTTEGMSPQRAAMMSEIHTHVAAIRVVIVVVATAATLVVAGVFVPPLVSAFRHWEAFE